MSSSLFHYYEHLSCFCCAVAVNVRIACEHATNFGSCFSFFLSRLFIQYWKLEWNVTTVSIHEVNTIVHVWDVFFSLFILFVCLFVVVWKSRSTFSQFWIFIRTHTMYYTYELVDGLFNGSITVITRIHNPNIRKSIASFYIELRNVFVCLCAEFRWNIVALPSKRSGSRKMIKLFCHLNTCSVDFTRHAPIWCDGSLIVDFRWISFCNLR